MQPSLTNNAFAFMERGTAGNTLDIHADGDVHNISGALSGHDVNLTAGGDINHITHSQQVEQDGQVYTLIGQQAGIHATGNLNLDAGNDITITGARITAENLAATAARDININTVELKRAFNEHSNANNRFAAVQYLSAELETVFNQVWKAGQSMELVGANLTAGGDLSLEAEGAGASVIT